MSLRSQHWSLAEARYDQEEEVERWEGDGEPESAAPQDDPGGGGTP